MTQLLSDGNAREVLVDPQDWPRCAVCEIPVEKFSSTDTGTSIVFVAQCHGQIESAEIPDNVWDDQIGTHMNFGLAFSGEQNVTALDI